MTSGSPLDKPQYELLAAWRYALRQFLRFSEEAAQAFGVTPQQHQALLAIKGFPGRSEITVGELAERLQVRHHSAVGLVDRLVRRRLLRRRRSAADRRTVLLSLTSRGERILDQLTAAHREQLRRLGPEIAGLLRDLEGNHDSESG